MADTQYLGLTWDDTSKHLYETGVSHGVLFVYDAKTKAYKPGVAWNGLTAVTESPSGAEATALYADDKKYLNLLSVEEFGATIEAYTYPDEFGACNGEEDLVAGVSMGQQARSKFAFCYETKVGNADDPNAGKKLHIIYGALAAPSEKAYATVNDSPEAITFSWEVTTTPVSFTVEDVEGNSVTKTTACVTVDSTKVGETKFKTLTDKLYGTADAASAIVMPDEFKTLLA